VFDDELKGDDFPPKPQQIGARLEGGKRRGGERLDGLAVC